MYARLTCGKLGLKPHNKHVRETMISMKYEAPLANATALSLYIVLLHEVSMGMFQASFVRIKPSLGTTRNNKSP